MFKNFYIFIIKTMVLIWMFRSNVDHCVEVPTNAKCWWPVLTWFMPVNNICKYIYIYIYVTGSNQYYYTKNNLRIYVYIHTWSYSCILKYFPTKGICGNDMDAAQDPQTEAVNGMFFKNNYFIICLHLFVVFKCFSFLNVMLCCLYFFNMLFLCSRHVWFLCLFVFFSPCSFFCLNMFFCLWFPKLFISNPTLQSFFEVDHCFLNQVNQATLKCNSRNWRFGTAFFFIKLV